MAEQTTTNELNQITTQNTGGFLAQVGNAVEKFQKYTNEPAVQRSIPVMITLFVIFIGIVIFLSFREPPRTALFASLRNSNG